jgi:hypothetical protein
MLYFASDPADKPDEMTTNPRCTQRAFVLLTVVLFCLTGSIATARGAAAGVRSTTAATAATAAATSQPTAAPATGPSTAKDTGTAAPAAASAADERADWSRTMNRLATLLAGKDLPALQRLLQPSPVIRPFGSDALQTHERLLGATTGSTVLGVHAYDNPPTTLATDLANDFHNAGDQVPPSVRDGMLPPDEATARRANETAAEWLVQVLQPEKHEVSGVIVLWPQTRGRLQAAAPKRATFVLVKAEKVDGVFVLRRLTFGDPLETPQ